MGTQVGSRVPGARLQKRFVPCKDAVATTTSVEKTQNISNIYSTAEGSKKQDCIIPVLISTVAYQQLYKITQSTEIVLLVFFLPS